MELTAAQVTSFHTRGYLVIEDLLPKPVLNSLRKEAGRLLRAYRDCGAIEQEAGCILGIGPFRYLTFFIRLMFSTSHAEPLGAVITQGRVNPALARSSAEYLELRARFNDGQVGQQFLFSPLLRSVLSQLMGSDLYLVGHPLLFDHPTYLLTVHCGQFNEQYIVKTPNSGDDSKFVLHQVSIGLIAIPSCQTSLCLSHRIVNTFLSLTKTIYLHTFRFGVL